MPIDTSSNVLAEANIGLVVFGIANAVHAHFFRSQFVSLYECLSTFRAHQCLVPVVGLVAHPSDLLRLDLTRYRQ